MKIALDVMGTDYGPKELVLGAVMAVKEYKCDEIKSSAPQAVGPRTVVVPIKETPRKKNELPYDFLDD